MSSRMREANRDPDGNQSGMQKEEERERARSSLSWFQSSDRVSKVDTGDIMAG